MVVLPLVLTLIQVAHPVPQVSPDSAEAIRNTARRAERDYEYLLRSMAPTRYGRTAVSRSECDEIVGRFCLTYGDGTSSQRRAEPEEPGRVKAARQKAVEALRRAFAVLPGELTTAGPLLRYLVEDGRAEEAVSAARAFSWASGDSIWGPLLEGYAFHAAGDGPLAETRFSDALLRLEPDEARRYLDLSQLLPYEERQAYRGLDEAARAEYEEAFWRLADPLYLLEGNERRAEHLARHVWSRLLAERPVVMRVTRWSDDLEELTIRYGIPTSRERIISSGLIASEGMAEYFHPEQIVLDPEALLTAGFPETPPPGAGSPFMRARARSGHAPRGVRRISPIPHQVTRFPVGTDSVAVRINALFVLDRADEPREVRTGLFLLDARYRPWEETVRPEKVDGDTVWMDFEVTVPREMHVYSVEAVDSVSRLAGRARYRLEPPEIPLNGPVLSDIVVAYPYGTSSLPESRNDDGLRPRAELSVSPNETLGLYAEAAQLLPSRGSTTAYRVRLTLRPAEDPALLARAARWLGRTLRIIDEEVPPSLQWEGEGRAGAPVIIAVDLPLAETSPGLYAIELSLTDLAGGATTMVRRLIRVTDE